LIVGDYTNFTTFYFSGTGNTRWVTELFNNIVVDNGHKAKMYSIDNNENFTDDLLKEIICESDLVGFANPIYGAGMPPIMIQFINRLINIQKNGDEESKLTYMISTYGYINAFGPIAAKKLFANTCFHLSAYTNIHICNNISTPKLKVDKISDVKLSKRKEKAKKELSIMVERLVLNKSYITGIGPYLIPGIIIRKNSKEMIKNNFKALNVTMDTCIRCMWCVNNCPTHSISIEVKDNQFKFSVNCTACMRCYNFCPTSSITIDGVFADPSVYQRYRGPDIV
jgi:ferredoxin